MRNFKYTAIKNNRDRITDVVQATDFNEAKSILRNRELRIIEIKEIKNKNLKFSINRKKRTLSAQQVSHFCRQFGIIVSSGINSITGLETLGTRSHQTLLTEEINRIVGDIKVGYTIADSMLASNSKFPKLLGAMVATGEATGKLDEILKSMASFYEREHRIRQKLKNASTYPLIILIASFTMIFIFTAFMLPMLIESVLEVGAKLPFLTRMVIAFGMFMKKYWILVFLVIILGISKVNSYIKTSRGRAKKDKLINKIPLLGLGVNSMVSMRFSRALYLFVSTGYPLLQGLDYIIDSVNNSLAEKTILKAKEGITKGESLAENLEKSNYFDPVLVQMIAIGEQTGQLESISKQMADFYEHEAEIYLNRLVSIVEPVMIIVVGIIVAVLVISIFMPMLSMYDAI